MTYSLYDTHSHLYLEQFNEDIDAVVQQALENKVDRIYLPNIDSATVAPLLDLQKKYPEVFRAMAGLHPTDVKDNYRDELAEVKHQLDTQKGYVAVGEIGIDLYWDKTHLKEQIIAFEQQVQWALDYRLPIVIHARDSFDEIFASLENFKSEPVRGIFHSFTGSVAQAEKALSLGEFKLGINGIVTFKNAGLDKVVKEVGVDHLVLETDAPFLAPTPFRGKRNESAYLINIAQKLADVFQLSLQQLADVTTNNAKEIFGE